MSPRQRQPELPTLRVLAVANLLLHDVARRWGMADAHLEAVSSLLHERAPREVSVLRAPSAAPAVDHP